MIDWLIALDHSLMIFLNNFHFPILDVIMKVISGTSTWIPLYAVIIFLLIKAYKKKSIIVILTIVLLITLCDQFASGFMKPHFKRLRPCHSELKTQLHVPYDCGGSYGFISSHAANTFGLALFISLLWRGYWVWLLLWAGIVSYSRVYLGVHYPADIILGAFSGMLFATCCYYIVKKYVQLNNQRL